MFKLEKLHYLPSLELFKYLTNATGEDYRIPFTFFQILQHLKYAAMYSNHSSDDGKGVITPLIESLLIALQNLNQRHSFAAIYGLVLARKEFIVSNFFRSITSQLYIMKRDVLISIAGLLFSAASPLPAQIQLEAAITKKWEELILSIPPEASFLNGVNKLKKAFTPNFHLSLWSALKTPQAYLPCELPAGLSREYPDVCIAYRTLLSFPRLVNVHDWAGTFASVLGFTEVTQCSGRFLYSLKCLLLVGVIRNKIKKVIPDFVERCNLGDACQF
jgi:hypothetical protein